MTRSVSIITTAAIAGTMAIAGAMSSFAAEEAAGAEIQQSIQEAQTESPESSTFTACCRYRPGFRSSRALSQEKEELILSQPSPRRSSGDLFYFGAKCNVIGAKCHSIPGRCRL